MGEYGRTVGETSGAIGSRAGTGSSDIGGNVMGALSNLFDQVASLPPEILVLIVAAVMIGGFVMSMRTS